MRKKILSSFLAASLVLGMIPTAFAAHSESATHGYETVVLTTEDDTETDSVELTDVVSAITGETVVDDKLTGSTFSDDLSVQTTLNASEMYTYSVALSGKLKFVDNVSVASGGTNAFQSGHFIALKIQKPSEATGTVKVSTNYHFESTMDSSDNENWWGNDNAVDLLIRYENIAAAATRDGESKKDPIVIKMTYSTATEKKGTASEESVTYSIDVDALTLESGLVAATEDDTKFYESSEITAKDIQSGMTVTMTGAQSAWTNQTKDTGVTTTYSYDVKGTLNYIKGFNEYTKDYPDGNFFSLDFTIPDELKQDAKTVDNNDTVTISVMNYNGAESNQRVYSVKDFWGGCEDGVQNLLVNTKLLSDSNKLTVDIKYADQGVENHVIHVFNLNFTQKSEETTYTVTISEEIANGTVTVAESKESYKADDEITFTVTANEGYELESLKVGESTVEKNEEGKYVYTVKADDAKENVLTVTATFKQKEVKPEETTYTVTISEEITNGTVTVAESKESYKADDEITFTVTANEGYELESLKVGESTVEKNDGGKYVYTVKADDAKENVLTVTATFKQIQRTITLTKAGTTKGDYTVNIGETTVESGKKYEIGQKVTITATPGQGYEVASITATGVELVLGQDGKSGDFTMGSSNVVITVTFKATPVAVDKDKVTTEVNKKTETDKDGNTKDVVTVKTEVKTDSVTDAISSIEKNQDNETKPEITIPAKNTDQSVNTDTIKETKVSLPKEVTEAIAGTVGKKDETTGQSNKIEDVKVTVETDHADVTINTEILKQFTENNKTIDVTLSVEKNDATEGLKKFEDTTIQGDFKKPTPVDNTKVVEVSFQKTTDEGKTEEFKLDKDNNNAEITLTLNFGLNASQMSGKYIFWLDEDGTMGELKPGEYTVNHDGSVTFTVKHLTSFGVSATSSQGKAENPAPAGLAITATKDATNSFAPYAVTVSGLTANGDVTVQVRTLNSMAAVVLYLTADGDGKVTFNAKDNVEVMAIKGIVKNASDIKGQVTENIGGASSVG